MASLIFGARVPHAKNQPPRSKTVAYRQNTGIQKVKTDEPISSKFQFLTNERSDKPVELQWSALREETHEKLKLLSFRVLKSFSFEPVYRSLASSMI